VIRAGAVGLNLEDPVDTEPPGGVGSFSKGDTSVLVELEEQAERIRAAVEAGREAGVPLGGQRQDRRLLEGGRGSR
jgi:2-methylisocitrate lyase-like PEP mutase family enzyme